MVKIKIIKKEDKESHEANSYYHEDCGVLSVHIKKGKVFKTISDYLETDVNGELICIELVVGPTTSWITDNYLKSPENIIKGSVRMGIEDNNAIYNSKEVYYTNKNKDILYIQIEKEKPVKSIEIAKNILLDITDKDKLAGIWILCLPKNIP